MAQVYLAAMVLWQVYRTVVVLDHGYKVFGSSQRRLLKTYCQHVKSSLPK